MCLWNSKSYYLKLTPHMLILILKTTRSWKMHYSNLIMEVMVFSSLQFLSWHSQTQIPLAELFSWALRFLMGPWKTLFFKTIVVKNKISCLYLELQKQIGKDLQNLKIFTLMHKPHTICQASFQGRQVNVSLFWVKHYFR